MIGFYTLFRKEVLRFWKVGFQTIGSPMLTTLLYLLIFSHVLERHVQIYPGVEYTVFNSRFGDDGYVAKCFCQFLL